ncbi:MAG: rhodanese-like domain-containing protein [Pseudomonadales bacterium]
MELFFQFASYNWYWFGLLALLIAVLLQYENKKAGPSINTQNLTRLVNKEEAVVIDLRSSAEFDKGHVVNAVNLSFEKLGKDSSELDKYKEKPVILVCKMGQSAGSIAKKLRVEGFQTYRLSGGMTEWSAQGLPLVKGRK